MARGAGGGGKVDAEQRAARGAGGGDGGGMDEEQDEETRTARAGSSAAHGTGGDGEGGGDGGDAEGMVGTEERVVHREDGERIEEWNTRRHGKRKMEAPVVVAPDDNAVTLVGKCQRAVKRYSGQRWRGTRMWRGSDGMNGGKGGVLRDGPLRQDGVRVRRCTPSSSTAPARSVLSYLLLLLLRCTPSACTPVPVHLGAPLVHAFGVAPRYHVHATFGDKYSIVVSWGVVSWGVGSIF